MNSKQKYKTWKDKHGDKEFKNYQAFEDDSKNRVVLFDSADELITCFKKNIAPYGGTGQWKELQHIQKSESAEDEWRFGNDFPTLGKTNKALSEGAAAMKYLKKVELRKSELFTEIPSLKELSEIGTTKRRRRIWTDDGDDIDVSRYIDGTDQFYVSMPRQEVKGKIARMYISFSVSAGVDAETITDNVIAMAAIADIIQSAGVFVEIYASCAAKHPTSETKWFNVACMAKSASEPLDIARMMTFGLPGFFRNYVFGTWSNIINESETVSPGLGYPVLSSTELEEAAEFFEADIKINGRNKFKEKEALNVIIGEIEKFFMIEKS